MTIEMQKPRSPKITTPIAETFAMVSNSFRDGFFKANQTLLHLTKNDFVKIKTFFINKKTTNGFLKLKD